MKRNIRHKRTTEEVTYTHIHTMDLQQVFCMVRGEGETSYATNSILQETIISKARPFIEEVVKDLYAKTSPESFTIADLGCSSGPNSLLVISNIISTINALSCTRKCSMPEFEIFLNDLPSNDFNTLFKSISAFHEKLEQDKGNLGANNCFISGTPGSFYRRLFRRKSLWFVHSSYSVHWLSQVPRGIESNIGNVYMGKTSPQSVFKAYLEQFQKDFSGFLSVRAEEMTCGGKMVLTVSGRRSVNPSSKECCRIWELLSESLNNLVSLGLVEEDKANSFNVPCYTPCAEEIRDIVNMEGSFELSSVETFDVNWDANEDCQSKGYVFDNIRSGQNVAKCIRAVTGPLLVSHFGEQILDPLFSRFAERVAKHLAQEKTKHVNLIMSMTRKA